MKRLPWLNRRTGIIFTLALFYWTSMGSVQPIVPLLADRLGAGPGLVGLIVTMRSLMPFFIAIPVGKFTDVVGRKKVLQLGALGMVSGGLVYLLSTTMPFLVFAQVIEGVGELLFWTALQAVSTDGSSGAEQQSIVGVFSIFIAVGQFLGPSVGGLVADQFGYYYVFAMHAAISSMATFLILFLTESGFQTTPIRSINWLEGFDDARVLIRRLPMQVALVATFSMLFTLATWNAFYPLTLQNQFQLSVATIGIMISIRAFGQIVIRPLMPVLVQALGERPVLYGAMAISTIGVTITPVIGHSVLLLSVVAAISGAGLGLNMPLTILMIANASEQHRRGIGMSLRLVVNRLAQLVNPVMFGLISEGWGLISGFYLTGTLIFVVSGSAMLLLERRSGARQAALQHGVSQD